MHCKQGAVFSKTASQAKVGPPAAGRWRFFLQELPNGHWVSVARGPPDNIVDALQEFTGTLEQPVIPAPAFQVLPLNLNPLNPPPVCMWVRHCYALGMHHLLLHALADASLKPVL